MSGNEDSSPADPSALLGPFSYSLGALGFVSFTALVFNIFLARLLDVEAIGHIRIVRTVLELAAIPAALGMGACVARHAGAAGVNEDQRAEMASTGVAISLGSGLAVALVVFALLWIPGVLRDRTAVGLLRWMIFVIPLMTVSRALLGYLQGTGRIGNLAIAQVFRSSFLLVSGMALAMALRLEGWAVARAATEAAVLVACVVLVGRSMLRRPGFAYFGSFLRFGAFTAITQGLGTLVISIDVLCLDRFLNDPAEMGQYAIATLVLSTALLLPGAFVQSHFSRMAEVGSDAAKTWDLFVRYIMRVIAMALPAALAGYFLSPAIVWVFGPDYRQASEIFRWFLPAFVIQSAGLVGGNFMASAGLVRANFFSALTVAIANVVLNLIFIPRWGIGGAVAATTISFALRTASCSLLLRRHGLKSSE